MNRSILMLPALWLGSCSLTLSWDECDASRPCPDGGTCNLGVCEVSTDTDDPGVTDDTDPPISTDDVVDVSGIISEDTTWTADKQWRLTGIVYVDPGVELTLEPGVRVLGTSGSVLVIERGARIDARGTSSDPVVFTSAKPAGERAAGDWGGLVLLGDAVNMAGVDIPFSAVANGSRGEYGGDDDESTCGTLSYVRIEFAGISGDGVDEVSALELAGCGSATVIDYVQVHAALDEGVDILGGAVRLRHLLVTVPGVSGVEWAEGWHGNAQFVAVHLGNIGELGFEADESMLTPVQQPESRPEMFNMTLLASGDAAGQVAIEFSQGTRAHMHNMIIAGHSYLGIEVKDEETAANLDAFLIEVAYSLFFDIGDGGEYWFPTSADETAIEAFDGRDDDGGFDEDDFFRNRMEDNVFGVDPEIEQLDNVALCGWVPQATLPNVGIPPHEGQGFVPGTRFLGAFDPGATPWHEGWTTNTPD